MNRTLFFKRGHLVFAALVAIALGALAFACGSNDDGPGACEGSDCADGGTPESSTPDSPGADTSIADGGTETDADADSSIPSSCSDGGEPGTLDPTFGDGGMVWLKYAGSQASGVAVQADGKIIVVGATQAGFGVIRLLASGAPDTAFGTNGLVTTLIGNTGFYSAVAIQGDGKIVATGGAQFLDNRSYDFAVARYLADGGLDPSFGEAGVATTSFGPGPFQDDYPQSIVLQPDGRILVGGYTETNSVTSTENFALARYNTDGSPDTAFGTGGKVVIDVHGTPDAPGVVALVPGGKIVIAGGVAETTNVSSRFDVSAVRLNADGSFDTSFADAGVLVTGFGKPFNSPVHDIKVDGTGRIVLAGVHTDGVTPDDFGVFRVAPSGALDTTFGDGGVVSTDFSSRSDSAGALLMQEDGKLTVAGGSGVGSQSDTYGIALARYLPTGSLDPTFGTAGRSLLVPPPNTNFSVSAAIRGECSLITVGVWGYDLNTAAKNAIGIARFRR